MKKIFSILLFIIISYNILCQESNIDSKLLSQGSFFKKNIGKEIIVNIKYNDLTIIGVLNEVLKEGIIINTKINIIFIPFESIAFAKVKLQE